MQAGHTCESKDNSWSPEGLRTEITAKVFDLETISDRASLVTQRVKSLPAMQETRVWFPRLGRSPGEGNGYPLQYSCLEHSMDRGAWWTTDHGVARSQTWLDDPHFQVDLAQGTCTCFSRILRCGFDLILPSPTWSWFLLGSFSVQEPNTWEVILQAELPTGPLSISLGSCREVFTFGTQ